MPFPNDETKFKTGKPKTGGRKKGVKNAFTIFKTILSRKLSPEHLEKLEKDDSIPLFIYRSSKHQLILSLFSSILINSILSLDIWSNHTL